MSVNAGTCTLFYISPNLNTIEKTLNKCLVIINKKNSPKARNEIIHQNVLH